MSGTPNFQPVPPPGPAYDVGWATRLISAVNVLVGKANLAADLTLAAGAATTTMTDARLSAFSVLTFMPVTANGAAVQASIWVSDQKTGEAVIHHSNTANTDQTFRVGILG